MYISTSLNPEQTNLLLIQAYLQETIVLATIMDKYVDYVHSQSLRTPSINNLCRFFTKGVTLNPCRIVSLEFLSELAPKQVSLDIAELAALLSRNSTGKNDVKGRVIIIEDITKEALELLGSKLNIDPVFFSSHLSRPTIDIALSDPSMATLPSQAQDRDFFTLQYHRVVEIENAPLAMSRIAKGAQITRGNNVPRKVALLPPIKNKSLALLQHGCSTLRSKTKDGCWLGKAKAPDKDTASNY